MYHLSGLLYTTLSYLLRPPLLTAQHIDSYFVRGLIMGWPVSPAPRPAVDLAGFIFSRCSESPLSDPWIASQSKISNYLSS